MNQPATLVLVRAGGSTDEYGNETDAEVRVDVLVAMLPLGSSEQTDRADEQTQRWDVYLPAGLGASGSSRLEIDDDVYHFEGAPLDWVHPRTMQAVYAHGTARKVAG